MASPTLPPPHEPLTIANLAPWLLSALLGLLFWSMRQVISKELAGIQAAFGGVDEQLDKVSKRLDSVLEIVQGQRTEAAVQAQRIIALESRVRTLEEMIRQRAP